MGLSFYPGVHGALLDAGLVEPVVLAVGVGGGAIPRYVSCCAGLAICNLHRHPGCAALIEAAQGRRSLHHTVAGVAQLNGGMPFTAVEEPSVNCERPPPPI